ncbi:MAG: hypothetical protein A2599_03550 [Candidatus Staskawiczbacteria bacterium RIFOXYD1_FULL_39_28]|uniref:Uncharacterized protein n=1 Tax=Candidatus Staskawiczbacteria bacterium RIFOXYC1_FULL_38_18 TaxID=1802229 RepID=A0A1G2JCB2_9BACT|nr:MAG: hypothetical protein A2401_01435 [Candidatus Staskawiczbacteria bacterium RIFOXYC1_FULL_38_18]OGZ91515.1 MAG: hypothetical protein A2599_03550 [Candidatus Staskawiczbacteria bacterium RIFOXYD1_FULL_39_28]
MNFKNKEKISKIIDLGIKFLFLPCVISLFSVWLLIYLSINLPLWFNFGLGLSIIIVSSLLINPLIQVLYKINGLKEFMYPSLIQIVADFLEVLFFAFLFIFKQHLLITGYLVIKTLRKLSFNPEEHQSGPIAWEGKSIAIYSIYIILILSTALIGSLFIFNSELSRGFIYNVILKFFVPT